MANSLFKSLVLSTNIALILSACGSGGGNSSNAPVPPARVALTALSETLVENNGNVAASFTFNNPDGGSRNFRILSASTPADGTIDPAVQSADAALFTANTATETISFAAAPDFENPTDSDIDNVYNVIVRVTEGAQFADFPLSITIDDVNEGLSLRRIPTGISQQTFITSLPDGTGRLVITSKTGQVHIVDPVTSTTDSTLFADLSATTTTENERGLLGLAFAPDFATERQVYMGITNLSGDLEVRRYDMMSGSLTQIDPTTEDVLLVIPQPAENHNGGWLGFGPDGHLWITAGDGGGAGDPFENGQNTNSLPGSILRVDVSGDDFPSDPLRDYAIPADNPFATAGGLPEIFAYGVRNPWRASFGPDGRFYMGDVGQAQREEINVLTSADAGMNFGWNTREGTTDFEGGVDDPSFQNPAGEYDHSNGDQSITGGYVYRGPVAELSNEYVFADFVSGRLFSVRANLLTNDGNSLQASDYQDLTPLLVPDSGAVQRVTTFGEDDAGNLYIGTFFGEDIFIVED